ncbi:hypothetical protein [Streptomyces sp. NPDC026589]|uniref:hypothetical protein n=1 Tax=Streptomyces sp. NPDC026589 TaxID=3155609 RepID=UPI003408118A
MRENDTVRTVLPLLEALDRGDRAAALNWLSVVLGTDPMPPEHRATTDAVMSGTHLPYALLARRLSVVALGALTPEARARSIRWLERALLGGSPPC